MTSRNSRDSLMLIGGEMVASESGQWIESTNPANEEFLGRVPRGNAADVAKAVAAAKKAQPAWAAVPVSDRAKYLDKLTVALMARADEILKVEVLDTGNTIAPMRTDLSSGIERLKFFTGMGYELKGHSIPATPGNLHFTVREPYGVVGRILAFNHPIFFAIVGMAAPLMAGNTIIEKPSEQSPLSAAILGEIASDILPPGVLNVLSGYGHEVGDALVRHPQVKRLSFVGSAKTGMAIQRSAAEVAVKHVSLECGGKNPLIIFPDADYERALAAAISGMNFGWQGQSCGSTSRVFVHESLYDRFVEDVAARVAKIRVGDPMAEDSQMGPINSAGHYQKVLHYISAGREDGARLIAGGGRPEGAMFAKGYWVQPTVFADVTPDMRIAREEIFGPVLSILKWKDTDAMIEAANAVDLGLTASIWSRDIHSALGTARRIEAGYIWVNGVGAHVKGMPYGGYKNSGTGRERGLEELMSYTEEKAIHIML